MANIYDMADTWNDGATTFTAIKMNVTDTASNASSLLMDLQVGGVSQFRVNKNGLVEVDPANNSTATMKIGFFSITTLGTDRISSAFDFGYGARIWSGGVRASASNPIGWASGLSWANFDLTLYRDAAGTLAQRNGANAQTFNLYASYTDSSNYTRGAFKASSGLVNIEGESAGTGDADIDVQLTPKGTGRVRFGTHAAVTTETVTGYIIIKDSGGTERKVAVVS